MSRSLSGKRALITGSTQGLGLAIATRLAADGCDVVIHGLVNAATLDAICEGFERDHAVRALSSSADLRRPVEIGELIAATERSLGAIDILVNNAVARHNAPVEAFTTADWDESVAVNLSAAFHTIRLV